MFGIRGQGKGFAIVAVLMGISAPASAGDDELFMPALAKSRARRSAGSNSVPKIPAIAAAAHHSRAIS